MAAVLEKLKKETYPIVKWVGGKRQLMFELLKNMPKSHNRYFEPFVGGGALFFNIAPKKAFINDSNTELMLAYKCFSDIKLFNLLIIPSLLECSSILNNTSLYK